MQCSEKVINMFVQKASFAGLAAAMAIALASAPALADPIVLNPNFTINDTAANNSYNGGKPFYVQNWSPGGYASNSNTDPAQFDNGKAGGQAIVGFLSGVSSLSQVVQGFIAGRTYRVSVGANARAQPTVKPTFQISADNVQLYGPTTLASVDPIRPSARRLPPFSQTPSSRPTPSSRSNSPTWQPPTPTRPRCCRRCRCPRCPSRSAWRSWASACLASASPVVVPPALQQASPRAGGQSFCQVSANFTGAD